MTDLQGDLNLTDPTKGYLHFVVYTEQRLGIASASRNGEVTIRKESPYAREWLDRLERCKPNALHCMLVEPTKIPALFDPCVKEDKDSPSAVRGSGCVCQRPFYDPVFGLPVVGDHFKHVGDGGTDEWTYETFAPLALLPGDRVSRFMVDYGVFWVRSEKGVLSLLPQRHGSGYNIGYGGGGPHALAAYLSQIAATDGENTVAGTPYEKAAPGILAWTESPAAERGTNELTLRDLKAMQRS
ncbi:hypothetical protein [Streptomyces sp. G45]|uniref:hypothetical protein n=1 Tax=Streptomyces sp. G45 TaxID=3406627 RepID=UPI003C14ECE6